VDGGLSDVLEWDTKRGRDFQNIAHMVFCCDGLPDELLPTAQKIEKWISRIDYPPEQFKADIEEVLTAFWRIASNKNYNEAFTKITQRIAPVEFIFIGKLRTTTKFPSSTDALLFLLFLKTLRCPFISTAWR
jgi:hypothetical protein